MGKDEETEIAVECSVLGVCFLFDVGRSMFDVHFLFKIVSERHFRSDTIYPTPEPPAHVSE